MSEFKKKVGIRKKKSEFEKKEADISMALMGLRTNAIYIQIYKPVIGVNCSGFIVASGDIIFHVIILQYSSL